MARVSEALYVGNISHDEDTDEDDIEELEDAFGRIRHLRHELMDALHKRRCELFFDRGDTLAREDASDRDLFFLLFGRWCHRKHFGDEMRETYFLSDQRRRTSRSPTTRLTTYIGDISLRPYDVR